MTAIVTLDSTKRPARRAAFALFIAALAAVLATPSSAWAQYGARSSGFVSRGVMATGSGVQSLTARTGNLLSNHGRALQLTRGNQDPRRGQGLIRVGNAIDRGGQRVGNAIRTTPGRVASGIHNVGQRVANRANLTGLRIRARSNALTLHARQGIARAVGGHIDARQSGRVYQGRTATFRGVGGESRTDQTEYRSDEHGHLTPGLELQHLSTPQGRMTSTRLTDHVAGRTQQYNYDRAGQTTSIVAYPSP